MSEENEIGLRPFVRRFLEVEGEAEPSVLILIQSIYADASDPSVQSCRVNLPSSPLEPLLWWRLRFRV
jgi:hypothetical protein